MFVYEQNQKVVAASYVRELEGKGKLVEDQVYDFEFDEEKDHESYIGENVSLKFGLYSFIH